LNRILIESDLIESDLIESDLIESDPIESDLINRDLAGHLGRWPRASAYSLAAPA
jgi:hypothetical protein